MLSLNVTSIIFIAPKNIVLPITFFVLTLILIGSRSYDFVGAHRILLHNCLPMFGVLLCLCTLCVSLCIATFSSEVTISSEDHPGTWNLKSQASCALDHLFYPLMF
jgi:hypothetical protein